MNHEESLNCWCCPEVVRELDEDGEVIIFVIHHEREEAN